MTGAGTAAVFLDRDGTIVREVGYLSRAEQLAVLPRAAAAIRRLNDNGFKVVIITNQSGVARGFLTEAELIELNGLLLERLAQQGAIVQAVYYCPHHPTEGEPPYRSACDCRKPNDGLIRRAAEELGIDPSLSYLVGDQTVDVELAARVGATALWIGGRADEVSTANTHCVADLWEAVEWIIERSGARLKRRVQ